MKLTGKCKEDFEKWYYNRYADECIIGKAPYLKLMEIFPLSMQYGIMVDFFDNVGINVTITQKDMQSWFSWRIVCFPDYNEEGSGLNRRYQARELSIKKANELYNEKFN